MRSGIGKLAPASGQSQAVTGKGGGSKPTPQTAHMKAGSGKIGSTAPKSPQKLRG